MCTSEDKKELSANPCSTTTIWGNVFMVAKVTCKSLIRTVFIVTNLRMQVRNGRWNGGMKQVNHFVQAWHEMRLVDDTPFLQYDQPLKVRC